MGQPIVAYSSKQTFVRIVLGAAILAALLFAWFSVRWQLGNMLAELTPLDQPNAAEVAQLATRLAPSDPMPMWLSATKEKEVFDPVSIENSVKKFENIVRLSPYDFRWWIELGRSYEQAEKPEQAERAFQRAVELAPTYTFPHWQFGNFYLRQNRSDEAFAELRRTTEQSIVYREQVFSLAWDYFDKDPEKLEAIAADTPDVRANLASFYSLRGSAENALRVWNALSPEDKERNAKYAPVIAQVLHDKKRFREALEFSRQAGIDPESVPETVSNGGFEKFIGPHEGVLFGWAVFRNDGKLDIAADSSVKAEGARSLRLSFKGYNKPELYNTVQTVAVEPGSRYRLSFQLRTENLRSGGMPFVQVANPTDGSQIAVSEAFPDGSADWQAVTIEFTVPQNTDGISLRTSRTSCGEMCPINGIVWYDNFQLTRM